MPSVLDAIGNTALVRLRRLVPHSSAAVYVKLELQNPTGSYKDRMALAMIQAAEARGELLPGMSVLECTGGSTGTSIAFVCAAKGYRCVIISSDAYAAEKLASMEAFGAQLVLEPSVEGRITPDLWPRMMARAEALRATEPVYYTNQFYNRDGQAGYARIGREVVHALPRVDAFCGMVGTSGMLMGAGAVLREAFPGVRVVALEPASSAVISGGAPGTHSVDGTGAGFVPPQFDRSIAPEARGVDEAAGREMARRLAAEEGIFAGTSTGLNVVAALDLAAELGPHANVVTVACDTGFKYLAGALFRRQRPMPLG